MTEPDYLTPEQVAQKLQMNARVVRRMLAAGTLPGKRVGRIWRVSAATLKAYIEGGERPAVKGENGHGIG
jgi:excisionase family DNA binding protein